MTITDPTQKIAAYETISARLFTSDTPGWALTHPYVTTFWLPVIGPTSTVLLGFYGRQELTGSYTTHNYNEVSSIIGVGGDGYHSGVAKSHRRLSRFDLIRLDSEPLDPNIRISVRSLIPCVPPQDQLDWPTSFQELHRRAESRLAPSPAEGPKR